MIIAERYTKGHELNATAYIYDNDLQPHKLYRGSVTDTMEYARTYFGRSDWHRENYSHIIVKLEQPEVSVEIILATYLPKR